MFDFSLDVDQSGFGTSQLRQRSMKLCVLLMTERLDTAQFQYRKSNACASNPRRYCMIAALARCSIAASCARLHLVCR
jgi:hypothetical protein